MDPLAMSICYEVLKGLTKTQQFVVPSDYTQVKHTYEYYVPFLLK